MPDPGQWKLELNYLGSEYEYEDVLLVEHNRDTLIIKSRDLDCLIWEARRLLSDILNQSATALLDKEYSLTVTDNTGKIVFAERTERIQNLASFRVLQYKPNISEDICRYLLFDHYPVELTTASDKRRFWNYAVTVS